jgi:hypothetical protein
MTSPAAIADEPTAWITDRAHLWLPLLRDLTANVPGWVVLKNSKAAMNGIGDIDSFASRSDFPDIEDRVRVWSAENGLRFVTVCRHNWRGPIIVAIRDGDPYLFSLDVKIGRLFRGSMLIDVDDAQSFAVMDDLGYRRVREGAEGVMKLLYNGMYRGGAKNEVDFEKKGVLAALQADPAGAMEASRLVGMAAPALRSTIRAVLDGGWSRRDIAAVEAWCFIRSAARPDYVIRQWHWRHMEIPRCAISQLKARRMPDDVDGFLRAVADTHAASDGPVAAPAA